MVWKDINKESKVLIDKLKLLSFKISAAESCTGGLLSSAIVNLSLIHISEPTRPT